MGCNPYRRLSKPFQRVRLEGRDPAQHLGGLSARQGAVDWGSRFAIAESFSRCYQSFGDGPLYPWNQPTLKAELKKLKRDNR